MALTTDELAEQASLKAALLALRTGKMPTRVVYNGEETDWAKVDLDDLKARLAQLDARAGVRGAYGAIGFRRA